MKFHIRERAKHGRLVLILFSIYLLVVLYITVFRFGVHYTERRINLTIFRDLINVYNKNGIGQFLWLLIGNIAWFVPFGFFLPVILKSNGFIKTVAFGFTFSFAIELLQYVFYKGVAELDDLLLNTLGVTMGYFLFCIVLRCKRERERKHKQE